MRTLSRLESAQFDSVTTLQPLDFPQQPHLASLRRAGERAAQQAKAQAEAELRAELFCPAAQPAKQTRRDGSGGASVQQVQRAAVATQPAVANARRAAGSRSGSVCERQVTFPPHCFHHVRRKLQSITYVCRPCKRVESCAHCFCDCTLHLQTACRSTRNQDVLPSAGSVRSCVLSRRRRRCHLRRKCQRAGPNSVLHVLRAGEAACGPLLPASNDSCPAASDGSPPGALYNLDSKSSAEGDTCKASDMAGPSHVSRCGVAATGWSAARSPATQQQPHSHTATHSGHTATLQ